MAKKVKDKKSKRQQEVDELAKELKVITDSSTKAPSTTELAEEMKVCRILGLSTEAMPVVTRK